MTLILCHSVKGGAGTTFLTAQLALAIARRGQAVTAVDFTYQDALKLHFGVLPNQFAPDFRLSRAEPLAISDVNLVNGFADKRDPAFREALRAHGVQTHAGDVVIADVAAADRDLAEDLYPHADLHLSPLLPDPVSLASLTRLGGDRPLTEMDKTVLVLNQLDDRRKLSRHSHRFIREVFQEQLIGTVRRDEAASEALAMFEPLAQSSPNSVVMPDIEALADAVLARCGQVSKDTQEGDAGDASHSSTMRKAG